MLGPTLSSLPTRSSSTARTASTCTSRLQAASRPTRYGQPFFNRPARVRPRHAITNERPLFRPPLLPPLLHFRCLATAWTAFPLSSPSPWSSATLGTAINGRPRCFCPPSFSLGVRQWPGRCFFFHRRLARGRRQRRARQRGRRRTRFVRGKGAGASFGKGGGRGEGVDEGVFRGRGRRGRWRRVASLRDSAF